MEEQRIHFCTAGDGVRLAYAVAGRGPPLVKAANWLSHLDHDWRSPVWRHWLRALSRDHTLIRYDERGCGLSDWEVDDFSFDAWVRDLELVVDARRLDRFPLLGISQGAAVAVAFAARHPERVSHLILYGGYARGRLRREPISQRQVAEAEVLQELTRLGWGRGNAAYRQVFTQLFMPAATNEQQRWLDELQRLTTSAENAVRFERVFHHIDVSDVAPLVRAPTLVLHARDDAMIPFDEGRILASLIPAARLVPLESGNHVLQEDEPAWPRFVEEIRGFLGVGTARQAPGADRPPFSALTDREREVLEYIARGLDNGEIGRRLFISPKTVRNHVTSIFHKLDVPTRAQAIVAAREAGFGRDPVELTP